MKALFAIIALISMLSGCAGNAVKPDAVPRYYDSLAAAAAALADSLATQAPAGLAETVPVDGVVNETTAEIAVSSSELQTRLIGGLNRALPGAEFQPLSSANLPGSKWIVLTSFRPVDVKASQNTCMWLRLRTALVEMRTGKRIAYAEAYLQSDTFDASPSPYFSDAPMYNTGDAAFRAKLKSIEGAEGHDLGATLAVAAKYAEAIAYYNDGQYSIASSKFSEVLGADPSHLGAFSGVYQSYWRQGMKAEAEKAFARFAEASIDFGKVSAKLLFSVGSTNFILNQDLAAQYRIWQKGLAQAASARGKCLDVVGHASRTGSESFNEKLSLQRAARIVGNMTQFVPMIGGKLQAIGKGSSQTIVGTGTDDERDAIDRRVDFLVRGCS